MFKYLERDFELRTLKTDFDCVHWVRVLEYLQNYHYEKMKLSGALNQGSAIQGKKTKEPWKKHSDADLQLIKAENQEVFGYASKQSTYFFKKTTYFSKKKSLMWLNRWISRQYHKWKKKSLR